MFGSKSYTAKIFKLNFRTLQVVSNNCDKIYHEVFNCGSDFSIHQMQFCFLAFEVYKSVMNINPEFMREFFRKSPVQYNLRKCDIVNLPPARSSCYRVNSLVFHGNLLRNNFPIDARQSNNIKERIQTKLKEFSKSSLYMCCV